MATSILIPACAEPQILQDDLDLFLESPTPVQQRFHPPPSPPPRIRSHYRPFSTLYTESPYIELDKKAAHLKHSTSSGGLQALNVMGINLKSKPRIPPADILSKISAPIKLQPKKMTPDLYFDRPSTSSGVLSASPTVTQVQMKKKRSMVSLFAVSGDATGTGGSLAGTEPNAGQRRSPLGSHQVTPPPSPTPTRPTFVEWGPSKTSISEDNTDSEEEFVSSHAFLPKHVWAMRHNMKLHPYHGEIPYMQAYDSTLLESDRQTDLLLYRLANYQPSFHDFSKKPPSMVLDLGCGAGHWAITAANTWKNTEVTGLDIVDITLPAFEATENLYFVQADFLERRLPFHAKRFDFVRMANLSLCIPKDKWGALFKEIHRVLAPGGRLEVIDDQIQFPYARKPKSNIIDAVHSVFAEHDECDAETLQGNESECGSTDSTLVSGGSRPPSFEGKSHKLTESATVRQIDAKIQAISKITAPSPPIDIDRQRRKYISKSNSFTAEYRRLAIAQQVHASKELEKIFRLMLRRQYGISYRPADRIVDYLHTVFGVESAGKKFSFHIKLAPATWPPEDGEESDDASSIKSVAVAIPQIPVEPPIEKVEKSEKRKNWLGVGDKQKAKKAEEKRKVERSSASGTDDVISRSSSERSTVESPVVTTPSYPASMNAKAAARLGLPLPPAIKGVGLGIHKELTTPTQAKMNFIPPPATPQGTFPSVHNDKAVKLMGTDPHGSPGKYKPRKKSRKSALLQSPGLIVWPSIFIPLNPVELEMHATKNIHSLLGCRAALADFFASYTDDQGRRLVTDDEFDDIMWNYECFRRRRVNWPSEIVDTYDDDELTNLTMFSSDSIAPKRPNSVSPPPTMESETVDDGFDSVDGYFPLQNELTHVRTIRVFHAVKAGPPGMSAIYSQSPTSSF